MTKKWGGDTDVLSSTVWQLVAGALMPSPAAVILEALTTRQLAGLALVLTGILLGRPRTVPREHRLTLRCGRAVDPEAVVAQADLR